MGSFGWSLPLVPLLGQKPATVGRVRRLVREALAAVWSDALPYPAWTAAEEWAFQVDLSLLTVGPSGGERDPAEDLSFRFYDGVDWPAQLCNHWLRLALAAGRRRFEAALAAGGLAVDPATWPSLLGALRRDEDDPLFVTNDAGAVGRIDDDRVAFWVVGKLGSGSYKPVDRTALEPQLAARVAAIVARRRCGCPYCERIRREACIEDAPGDAGARPLLATLGWRILSSLFAPSGERMIAVRSVGERGTWTLGAPSLQGPWSTLSPLSQKREVLCLAAAAGRFVATLGRSSGALTVMVSTDGGRTWSGPAPSALPRMVSPERFVVSALAPGQVFAFGGRGAKLHHCADGGESWREITASLDGRPVTRWIDVQATAEGRILALVVQRGRVRFAVGDADFHLASRPHPGIEGKQILVLASGTICVFGTRKASARAAVARSLDGGHTWSAKDVEAAAHVRAVEAGARCFWATRGGATDLWVSGDSGARWTPGAAIHPDDLFAEPGHGAIAAVRGTLFCLD